jgi:toxin FitB
LKFLVDANVLSEATKRAPDAAVLRWLRHNQASSVVDAVILGEILTGILLLPRGKKREALLVWFKEGVQFLECLPWDGKTSMVWAELIASLRKRGKTIPILDSLIAATALRHNLTIASRNEKDFRAAGVKVLNPFLA